MREPTANPRNGAQDRSSERERGAATARTTRRGLLRAAVGVGAAAAAGTAAGQPEVDYGGWFSNVSNFDGTVDRRGRDVVEVSVGA